MGTFKVDLPFNIVRFKVRNLPNSRPFSRPIREALNTYLVELYLALKKLYRMFTALVYCV